MLQLEALFGTVGAKADEQVLAGHGTNMDVELTGYEILADVEHEITEGVKMQSVAFQLDCALNMYDYVKRYGIDRSFLSLYNRDHQIDNFVGVRFPACEDMDSVGNPNSQISQLFIAAMEDENGGFFSKIIAFAKKVWHGIVNFAKTVWTKIKSWFINVDKQDEKINDKIQHANIPNGANANPSTPEPGVVKQVLTNVSGFIKEKMEANAEAKKLCQHVANMVKAGKSEEEIDKYITELNSIYEKEMRKTFDKEIEKKYQVTENKTTNTKLRWCKLFGIDDGYKIATRLSSGKIKQLTKNIVVEGNDMRKINDEIDKMITEIQSNGGLMDLLAKIDPDREKILRKRMIYLAQRGRNTDTAGLFAHHQHHLYENAPARVVTDEDTGEISILFKNPSLKNKVTGMFNEEIKLAAYHQKEAREIIHDLAAYRIYLHREMKKIYDEIIAADRDMKLKMNKGDIEGHGKTGMNDKQIEHEYEERKKKYGHIASGT